LFFQISLCSSAIPLGTCFSTVASQARHFLATEVCADSQGFFFSLKFLFFNWSNTRVGTLIVATIYLQLIQNRYMFRSFTVL